MGQVFRQMESQHLQCLGVLIPDLWGKSSDTFLLKNVPTWYVLIPDLWGKSSDSVNALEGLTLSLNPRFVGQVFRHPQLHRVLVIGCLNPRFVGQVFRLIIQHLLSYQSCLNPRFVGQVFRQLKSSRSRRCICLNPRFVGQVFRL